MRNFFVSLFAASLSLSLNAGDPGAVRLGGWLPYWRMPQAMERVRASEGQLQDAFLFVLQMDAHGRPTTSNPAREAEWIARVAELRSMKARVWITIVNDITSPGGRPILKDPIRTHEVLSSPSRRQEHIQALVAQCTKYGADGLDIDYENLLPKDRGDFSRFIQELAQALHAKGFLLAVTVQPKTRENLSVGPGAQDWAALGSSADRLQIMLYNLHNLRTQPGPVATMSWMEQVLAFALSQCEREKIVPALKVSGFAWGPNAREITFQDLEPHGRLSRTPLEREGDGMTPFMNISIGKSEHIAYCEDAYSLNYKIQRFKKKGFNNIILWSIGAEDPSFWGMKNN